MKKGKYLCFVGVLLLGLGGCSAFLEESYSSVTPHSITPMSEGTGSVTVESYYELVNGLLYFVTGHYEVAQIRFVDYDRDLAKMHMAEAVMEVQTETALGSYGVESVEWELNFIIGSLEAEIEIVYGKSAEEFGAIVPVIGSSAMSRQLVQNFTDLKGVLVLQNGYASSDRSQISQVIHQAFTGAAQVLVEIPEVHTALYPKEGPWRIVEFTFLYEAGEGEIERRQRALGQEIKDKTSQLWTESGDKVQILMGVVYEGAEEGEGDTPYDVLVRGEGDSRGFALSLAALCQEMGVGCQVIEGSFLGEEHYWNLVTLPSGGVHHVDVLRGSDEGVFGYYGDEEFLGMGYLWDDSRIPSAGVYEQE